MPRHTAISIAAAVAAVRLCKPVETSGLVAGATELAARKSALDAWKAKALAHGEEYAAWRLAGDKFLECLPRKEAGYECIARAAPCTIEQAPARRELRSKRLGI
jgi:hypothetical protein